MVKRFVKHVIPVIIGNSKNTRNVGKVDLAQSQSQLEKSLNKIKEQLGLKYHNEFQSQNVSVEQIHLDVTLYDSEKRTMKAPNIVPIPKFTFNSNDFPLTTEEVRSAPSEFPESRYPIVNIKKHPICKDYRELKGPNSDLYTLAILRGLGKQKSLYKCKWFSLNYWHSTTYLGKILKSRPGIMILCHNWNIFNSNSQITGNVPASIQNKSYPFKFSVYRAKLRKIIRKHFLDIYLQNPKLAANYDGFYRFSCTLYPRTDDDLQDLIKNIKIALNKLSELDLKNQEITQKELSKMPWYDINRVLSRNNVPVLGPSSFIKNKKSR